MTEHTPGRRSEESALLTGHTPERINHDIDAGVIMAGDRIIATMAYEPSNYGWMVSCSDARRLVACWNACEGAQTEWLEQNKPVKELADAIRDAQAQRDELLEVLIKLVEDLERRANWKSGEEKGVVDCGHGVYIAARAAIAKVEKRND